MFAIWRCKKCGECCRHLVGRKFGAAITPQEKRRLEILARKNGRNLHLQPLTTNLYSVTLWQFTDDVCPFLKDSKCMIYDWRPMFCRMYPLHPYGISECTSLSLLQKRGFQVIYPPTLKNAGETYIRLVLPFIRNAVKRYNLALGCWEWNRPFQVRLPAVI